jgi:two-component system response regulator AtoC
VNPVLVIDDDRSLRELLAMHLEERGLDVRTAATAAEGERLAREERPAAIVLDVHLPDRSGLSLIDTLRAVTDAPVLTITAFHDMATTILAMKGGAFDYLPKPIDVGAFDAALDRALAQQRAASDATEVPSGRPAPRLPEVVGVSPRMRGIFKEIGRVASSLAHVLVVGESGTGKELIARVVHEYSSPGQPFIAVNCASMVESLLESEMFGHEKGAFTGAHAQRPGKCELAGDGTLLLDEIGDMSLALQAKLLRVLQEREFERVGGVRPLPLRARVIAATHHDLPRLVAEGRFRNDLYQRLKVVTIELPPLRERREDIPLLVEHLLARLNERTRRRVLRVPAETMLRLQAHDWPGNIRQLENALLRAVIMAPGDVLLPELLPLPGAREPRPEPSPAPLPSLDDVERAHVARVLEATRGHRGRACEILGISRPTLERKLRRYGLHPRRSSD